MAALNRWTAQKRDLEKANNHGRATYMGGAMLASPSFGPYAQKKRPKIASECQTVKECDFWRKDILKGVAKKIAEIQNAALGEHRIRDLNDEINKDLREKAYWEDQIKALGGTDYKALAPKEVEIYGAELASLSGYKYFGAAKDLPGVRELFDTEAIPEAPRKTRKQLFRNIQPDYYGWRDEEDGMLLLAEQEAEIEAVQNAVARWKADAPNRPAKKQRTAAPVQAQGSPAPEEPEQDEEAPAADGTKKSEFKSYVDVPTMEDIQKLIVEKKKLALLKRYATPEMVKQSVESKMLLPAGDE